MASHEQPPTSAAGDESHRFATTHWSVVLEAGGPSPAAKRALARLCEIYWYPLYAYVRRRGHPAADAQDLTQQFFTHLLSTNSLHAADPRRGRFRSFLAASLNNFLANEWRKATAQKRGGGVKHLSLDFEAGEKRYLTEPAHETTAEKIYERRWAMTLLEQAVSRLHEEYNEKNKLHEFDELKAYLGVADESDRAAPYKDAAARLEMSEAAVKVAVHRLRKRCRQLLRDEIAHTVAGDDDIDDELRSLFDAVSS